MLIHIRHMDTGELAPVRLSFDFREPPLKSRLSLSRFVSGKETEEAASPPFKAGNGERIFAQLSPGRVCDGLFRIQVPPPSRDDITLVISPLSSLARDQGVPLVMNPAIRARPLHINYTGINLGHFRLLYISPESLISRSFRDDLNALIAGAPVSMLIIDNVHCISEWGHDFRPSYFRIPQVMKDLSLHSPRITTLALTAVPGEQVRKDIVSRLPDFRDATPPVEKNLYRPRVSFQVEAVSSPAEKAVVYEETLRERIPSLLRSEGLFPEAPPEVPAYHDPYDEALGLSETDTVQTDTAGAEILSVVTRRSGPASGNPHVLVHTSLGRSLSDWLFQAARHGAGENRIHCLRIIDMPTDACEADLIRRRTRVPKCSGFRCAFDRETLCDYGKQHHLIRQEHPTLADELREVLVTLDRLVASYEGGDNPVRILLADCESARRTELALYRLSVIRVVELFFIEYREGPPAFKVYGFIDAVEESAALAGLLQYLKQNSIRSGRTVEEDDPAQLKQPAGELARSREHHGETVRAVIDGAVGEGRIRHYDAYSSLFEDTARYMPLILRRVHAAIREMRYRQLWNLKEYVRIRSCRYLNLLTRIRATEEEWGCNFCDRCVPDLNFAGHSRTPPPEHHTLQALDHRFAEWVEKNDIPFDTLTADELIQNEGGFLYNILNRAHQVLEHDPRNLKALYLVRELSPEPVRELYAMDLMRTASFQLTTHQVIRLYDTSDGSPALKLDQFDLLDDEYRAMNSRDGERWLWQEAARRSLPADRTRMLGARMVLNALSTTDLSSHKEKLARLLKEL